MSEQSKHERIAETKVVFVDRYGTRTSVALAIGRPYQEDEETAHCTLYMDGYDEPRAIFGLDTLQALCLAIRLMRVQLEHLVEFEYKIYSHEVDFEGEDLDDYLLPIDACFGRK